MNRLLQAYRCKDCESARRQLRHWYNTEVGQALAKTELELLQQVLPNLFGYHLLQLGDPLQQDMLAASRIRHRVVLDDVKPLVPYEDPERSRLLGSSEHLPMASGSLDVLVLPHTLEFADNPHQVLREVDRALIPEGHVVILGFNPWSLFGLGRMLAGWRNLSPWSGHFYSATRVRDWLALLGFDTVQLKKYFFHPPLQSRRLLKSSMGMGKVFSRWWPLPGGAYMLVAKKREATITPIKPSWRKRQQVVPVAEPTAQRNRT